MVLDGSMGLFLGGDECFIGQGDCPLGEWLAMRALFGVRAVFLLGFHVQDVIEYIITT